MAGFKFKATKIDFPIVNENDEMIKHYIIDVGSEQFLRDVTAKGKSVVAELETIGKDDIDKSKESLKGFIDIVFGIGEFDFLFEKFDKNLFAMIELVKIASKEIENKWNERTKSFV